MNDKRTYSCLLFDMDGTIADTSEGIYKGLRYMAGKLGIEELPEDVMHTFLGPPLTGSLMKAYGMTEEEAVEAVRVFREYYSVTGVMECNPYPGFCETVKKLADSGVKIFVATSKPTPFAEKIVEKFGLADCFTAVIGSNIDNTRSKKAEVIQYILDSYKLDKNDCLMIGDKNNDIEGAKKCGIDSLGVTYGFGSEEELEGAGATYIVGSPEEILAYAGVKKMKRAMLTGATGAIGLALIKELINDGVEVLVLCHKGSKRIGRIPVSPLVELKDCSLDDLAGLTNDTGKEYDVFYHFAWAGTTGDARNDMPLQNRNVKYALDAVDCAARFGCKRFVGAGSQAEYGRVEGTLKPDTPAFPENGYGMAKLCAGQMTRIRAHQLGMEHVWPRILSVYGPFDGEASMVTSTIRKLLEGTKPSFTKGEQQWDYLYSEDAGKAFKLIGEKGKDGSVYPLGGGTARPLADYIHMMRDAANPGAELGLGDIPYGDKQVMYLCADITDLTRDTGWVPETDFETGIANTVAWLRG